MTPCMTSDTPSLGAKRTTWRTSAHWRALKEPRFAAPRAGCSGVIVTHKAHKDPCEWLESGVVQEVRVASRPPPGRTRGVPRSTGNAVAFSERPQWQRQRQLCGQIGRLSSSHSCVWNHNSIQHRPMQYNSLLRGSTYPRCPSSAPSSALPHRAKSRSSSWASFYTWHRCGHRLKCHLHLLIQQASIWCS